MVQPRIGAAARKRSPAVAATLAETAAWGTEAPSSGSHTPAVAEPLADCSASILFSRAVAADDGFDRTANMLERERPERRGFARDLLSAAASEDKRSWDRKSSGQ